MSIVSMHAFYKNGEQGVDAFLSRPTATGKHPALIVLHEWWGMDSHFRDLSRKLAREGYVVLVPDLYHGQLTMDPEIAARLKTSLDLERAVQDILGGVPYLRGLPFVDGERVGIVGFCMGGGLALLAACRQPSWKAAVIYFQSLFPDPMELEGLSCPLLGHYGEEDDVTPLSEVEEFRATLEKGNKEHEIHLYPGAGHAFTNDMHPERYHAEATEISWTRTLEFLSKHLKNSPGKS